MNSRNGHVFCLCVSGQFGKNKTGFESHGIFAIAGDGP